MKHLVTGAAGFIGYHTSEKLLARGDEVVGLDNLNPYFHPTLKQARLDRLQRHPNFRFVPVLSDPAPEDNWTGRTGLVHTAILADFPDLSNHQIYACGSVAMVETAHPAFVAHGMSEHDCFSDAFKLAPRLRTEGAEMVRLGGRA